MLHPSEPDIVSRVDDIRAKVARVKDSISRVIFGQDAVIELVLVNILSGGHALLIGVPGLAKTSLVEALGAALGLDAKRIQFTPDLMPSDIVGTEVLEEKDGRRTFRFVPGPVFAQLLMADEINRASPKTQSALLQAMQEQQVTYAGQTYALPAPFFVLATQNPLEQEGTYPLPEAQLDRFLLQVDVSYPDATAERRMLYSTTGTEDRTVQPVLTAAEVIAAQQLVRQIPAGDSVVDAILTLVRSARPNTPEAGPRVNELVAWGPGPRASQSLMLTVRARALLDGRFAPSIDDVIALAKPVLRHRMALTFGARTENVTVDEVIDSLLAKLK
ncbi:ATPase associated with various cellular activities AAA_3 [Rhodomicrobium vannielii ATCC 17100]|uniref:ATPase associated with various cellular activities AAA_3 n=2 Tax=Rhodomicrobium TaxID=1068 RepID=E3I5P1_RHOVT|nr:MULTISPECIES: MoxR family ATPase [Rhodomicrobium]ADP72852.1 ATPase associated with various cellular activities AAA_3 [Rhodomicrobium vannielii ATCC 17100]KAI95034.1 ATPase AAA [Rhodomicrobium udaipurense JA643]MBJ7544314.1 MoxR family ATPase [Rhodomicrobium udaipurense]